MNRQNKLKYLVVLVDIYDICRPALTYNSILELVMMRFYAGS